MMFGCLSLLALWAITAYAYFVHLSSAGTAPKWWLPVLLGLSLTIFVAQIWGLLLALRKMSVGGTSSSPDSWQDGQLVAISGRIQALKQALHAPASGRAVVIAEYEARRKIYYKGKREVNASEVSGFLMAPCAIQTMRGPIRLHGFPLLTSFNRNSLDEQQNLERFADFLSTATLEKLSSNPMQMIKELNEVLRDEDGDVSRHFVRPHTELDLVVQDRSAPEAIFETEKSEATASERLSQGSEHANKILRQLEEQDYTIEEQVIEPGTEVSVFGSYQAKTRSINIGGGLQNLSHSIQPGSLSSVHKKNLFGAIFGILFFGAVAIGANYASIPEVKSYLDAYIEKNLNTR